MNTYVITDYGVAADSAALQSKALQAVFDRCRDAGGGTVVVPAGEFHIASVRMWSDTTLLLRKGAKLIGSEECNDYEIYPVPEGVEMRSDMELIPAQYNDKPWAAYRRAMISAYGEKNIAVIGEGDCVIDGRDCFDPDGEEGFRGPHGIYITNCENVRLEGYTIQHSGNFMHQLDKCTHTVMRHVTCLGGSDGIHLHCCENTLIEDCTFSTGDDCIAGINVHNLTVRRCTLNTSCDCFCIGGIHILVEDCHMYGPGYYPHRMTVVRGRNDVLPREAGRHNLICLMIYFSSEHFPDVEPAHDIVFRNCQVDNARRFLNYEPDNILQRGQPLAEVTLDHVRFTGLTACSQTSAHADAPLCVRMRDVSYTFADNADSRTLLNPADPHTQEVEL